MDTAHDERYTDEELDEMLNKIDNKILTEQDVDDMLDRMFEEDFFGEDDADAETKIELKHKCICSMVQLLQAGCKCNGV